MGDKLVEIVEEAVVDLFGDRVGMFRVVGRNGVQEHPVVRSPNGGVHIKGSA